MIRMVSKGFFGIVFGVFLVLSLASAGTIMLNTNSEPSRNLNATPGDDVVVIYGDRSSIISCSWPNLSEVHSFTFGEFYHDNRTNSDYSCPSFPYLNETRVLGFGEIYTNDNYSISIACSSLSVNKTSGLMLSCPSYDAAVAREQDNTVQCLMMLQENDIVIENLSGQVRNVTLERDLLEKDLETTIVRFDEQSIRLRTAESRANITFWALIGMVAVSVIPKFFRSNKVAGYAKISE